MKYLIYIDESGSISTKIKYPSFFSVSLVVIKKEDFKKMKNWFKRETNKLKKLLGMNLKEELKAHTFLCTKNKKVLIKFIEKIRSMYAKDFAAYLPNDKADDKWFKNKNITYNFMVKSAIERAISIMKINKDDSISITADSRSINTGSFKSLNDYLFSTFVLGDSKLKSICCEFVESDCHWGVQMADFISWGNYNEIKNEVLSKTKRKIY